MQATAIKINYIYMPALPTLRPINQPYQPYFFKYIQFISNNTNAPTFSSMHLITRYPQAYISFHVLYILSRYPANIARNPHSFRYSFHRAELGSLEKKRIIYCTLVFYTRSTNIEWCNSLFGFTECACKRTGQFGQLYYTVCSILVLVVEQ